MIQRNRTIVSPSYVQAHISPIHAPLIKLLPFLSIPLLKKFFDPQRCGSHLPKM
jgi:hypothetical protein